MGTRHNWFSMEPERAFRVIAGRMTYEGDKGGGSAPAPDYSRVNETSDAVMLKGIERGEKLDAENKRQFDKTMAVAEPIIQSQTEATRENTSIGRDLTARSRSYRPYEDAMAASAFGISPEDMGKIAGMRNDAKTVARERFNTNLGLKREARLKQQAADDQAARLEEQRLATERVNRSPAGGFITVNGKNYSPAEIDQALIAPPSGEMGGNPIPQRFNVELDRLPREELLQAAKDAGYDYEERGRGLYMNGPVKTAAADSTSGMSSEARRSDGIPAQRSVVDDAEFDPATADESDANAYLARAAMDAQALHDEKSRAAMDPAKIDAYMLSQMPENERTAAGIQTAYDKLQGAYGNLQSAQTAGDQAVYNQNTGDIEFGVGNAVADARSGYSGAINQAIRQGMRYGFSPTRLSKSIGSGALGNASQVAAAANMARTRGIEGSRGRMIAGAGTGVTAAGANVNAAGAARDLQQANSNYGLQRVVGNRSMAIQDDATRRAKQLDVVGMARGLPGASAGAYGMANAAGNSAVQNTMAPSNSYLQNISAANGTIMQGYGLGLQGLTSAANGQANAYNADQQRSSNDMAGLGQLAGIGLKAGLSYATGGSAAPLFMNNWGGT